ARSTAVTPVAAGVPMRAVAPGVSAPTVTLKVAANAPAATRTHSVADRLSMRSPASRETGCSGVQPGGAEPRLLVTESAGTGTGTGRRRRPSRRPRFRREAEVLESRVLEF